MLKMPQIMYPNAGHCKAFCQMRAHGFYSLAHSHTEFQGGRTMGGSHAFAWSCDHEYPMALRQQGLSVGIDKPFICRDQPSKPVNQVVQQLNILRPGGQKGTRGDDPTARDAQTQLESIVVQLLGGTVTIISKRFETPIPSTAGVATDRQGQGINNLDWVQGLSTDLSQPLRDGHFDVPEGGGLPDKQGPVSQLRREVCVVSAKVGKEVFVRGRLEVFTAEFQRDHFFVAQGR